MNPTVTTYLLARGLSACVLSSAILAVVLLTSRRLSRHAAGRHLGWAAAFVLVLFLPLYQGHFPLLAEYGVAIPTETEEGRSVGVESSASKLTTPNFPVQTTSKFSIVHGLILVFGAVWLCGAFAIVLRAGAAIIRLRRLKNESSPFPVAAFDFPAASALADIRRPCQLCVSANLEVPLTWGLFRPTIFLPEGSNHWEAGQTRAILLHELAHVKRCDNFFQLIALAVCALHWFNPLVWICARRMRLEAEIACDDWVLGSGVRASSYAAEVLRFAARLNARNIPLALLGMSMASLSALEERIALIIGARHFEGRPRAASRAVILGACVSLVSIACFLRPTFAGGRGRSSAGPTRAAETNLLDAWIATPARPHQMTYSKLPGPSPRTRRSPDLLPERELRHIRLRKSSRRDGPSPDVLQSPPAWAKHVGSPEPPAHRPGPGADVGPR